MTTRGLSPVMELPDCATELVAITAMYAGTLPGSRELFPVSVLNPPPQEGTDVRSAKPLKLDGAPGRFALAHCASHHVKELPTAAEPMPMTKAPPPDGDAYTK